MTTCEAFGWQMSLAEIEKLYGDEIRHHLTFNISFPRVLNRMLYEHYLEIMPIGIAKGRTGDPDQWIWDKAYYDFVVHEKWCLRL